MERDQLDRENDGENVETDGACHRRCHCRGGGEGVGEGMSLTLCRCRVVVFVKGG